MNDDFDIHRLPVSCYELYEGHSRLADAKIPMGATMTHIYRARAWRRIDEKRGEGYARRTRIRIRKAQREPIVFDHSFALNDPRRVHNTPRTVPPSHKGRVA